MEQMSDKNTLNGIFEFIAWASFSDVSTSRISRAGSPGCAAVVFVARFGFLPGRTIDLCFNSHASMDWRRTSVTRNRSSCSRFSRDNCSRPPQSCSIAWRHSANRLALVPWKNTKTATFQTCFQRVAARLSGVSVPLHRVRSAFVHARRFRTARAPGGRADFVSSKNLFNCFHL
jgi:hypothetical protein